MPNEKENIIASSYYSSNLSQELEFGHGFEEDRQRAAQGSAKRSSNFIQSRWFGHVRRRPTEAPVKRCESMEIARSRRGRGRPKRSWKETIKHDLAYMDLTEDMVLNRFN